MCLLRPVQKLTGSQLGVSKIIMELSFCNKVRAFYPLVINSMGAQKKNKKKETKKQTASLFHAQDCWANFPFPPFFFPFSPVC